MKLVTDNDVLMRYVPNSIKPTMGEITLFEKITAHIILTEKWVTHFFTGSELLEDIDTLNPDLVDALRQLVTAEALHRAVPSLDLVLTPNGFGVVSTNTVGAASKQRVDRLLGNLIALRDEAIEQTLLLLPKEEDWSITDQAHFFASTLFPNIDLVTLCGITSARWDKYFELRTRCISIELTLAEDYFSPELMSELRHEFLVGSMNVQRLRLVHAIRSQVVDVLQDKPINGTRMRDLVNYIRHNPELFPTWHNSATAQLFSPPKFENKKKSSGYFF